MVLTHIKILLIEDNPLDVELMKVGFQSALVANNIEVITDGQEAYDYFDNETGLPDIVLLDINLPRVNGFEILRKIRSMPHSKDLPVVMLTSSEADNDIVKGYTEKVNCYISKPLDGDQFLEVIKSIGGFWFSVVKFPKQ